MSCAVQFTYYYLHAFATGDLIFVHISRNALMTLSPDSNYIYFSLILSLSLSVSLTLSLASAVRIFRIIFQTRFLFSFFFARTRNGDNWLVVFGKNTRQKQHEAIVNQRHC